MSLVGIESVTYGVDDLAAAEKFFADFGLAPRERGAHGLAFATPEGTTVVVRAARDPGLPTAMEPGPTVREVVWGVASAAALDTLAGRIEEDRRVTVDADGTVHTVDPTGYGIAFRVTARTPVALPPQTFNTIGATPRQNRRAPLYDRARPQHIGHVVLYAPDLDAALDFYLGRLGFLVSDRLTGFGAFLRCSTDHHNLFLMRHGRTGLNHLSFGVSGLDEIVGGAEFLKTGGWQGVWGLGRHHIGSNLFYYFRNPCGGYVEYYADMDCITDPAAWEPGEWSPTSREALVAWGGFPPPEFGA